MAAEKITPKIPRLPVIPLALTFILVAVYIFVVLVPAISKAGGIPGDIFSLIWPLVLIIGGLSAMLWGRAWLNRQGAEGK